MSINLKWIKVAIVVGFVVLATSMFMFSDSAGRKVSASFNGPPTGRTGAPSESTCTGCHNANSGVGQVNIIAPASYTPGQTYTIQVQNVTTDTSRQIWGFQMTSLTSANGVAGSFLNTDANTRVRNVTGGRFYIEQSGAGTFGNQSLGATWSFSWIAPATNVGPVTFYAAGLHGDNDGQESGDQTYLKSVVVPVAQAVVIHHGFTDFDGDGKADPSIFRSSDNSWYISRSTAGTTAAQWGAAGDRLTPADFDGDDKTDIAVWRAGGPTVAAFYILQSSTNTVRIELFGQTGDDPAMVGDWDGDGRADPAVYRDSAFGSQSYFFYRGSLNNPSGTVTYLPFGTTGDIPMRGDFDGDGKFDRAVFRPSAGGWYITQSSNGAARFENWGLSTDKFVPADYDGDAKTDLAVFRAGVWYIKQSSTGTAAIMSWGSGTDTLVPADYDADGKTDPAIYRSGVWYLRLSSSGALSAKSFGGAADQPVANAFVK